MTKNYNSVISHLQTRVTFFNKRGKVACTNYGGRFFSTILVSFTLFSFTLANAQIGVTVTNATSTTPALQPSYTSFNNALNDLNAVTAMTGSITLTLSGNTSETAPTAAGFVLGSATLNPLLSSTNTITIVKGTGGDVVLNAASGGTGTPALAIPDGIFSLRGVDYVTIDGLTFTDSNTANPATMEFGLGLFKASSTDGSSNNLIRNCIFNMKRINNAAATAPMVEGSVAILVINATATTAVTPITPTTASGTNSNNMIYSNTITGGNYGIVLSGFAAASPFTLGDNSNDIGGYSDVTGNTVFDFGGGAATSAAAGIRANNQWDLNISYNSIDNNTGSGVNHATTLRGIYSQAGTSASVTISYNSVTVRSGATTSLLTAIDNGIGSTAANNIVNITNNIISFSYTTATTGIFTAIANTSTAAAVNIDSNTIQQESNTAYPTTGTIPVVVGGSPNGTLTITNNTISDFVMTGASGTLRGITASTPVGLYTCVGNVITNLSYANLASTGSITGIYNLASATQENWNNNIISNFSTPTTGTLNGIQNNTVAGTFQCRNNEISNFSTTNGGAGGFSANGITWSNASVDIRGNYIYNIRSAGTTGGTGGTIFGITHAGAATVSKNTIYDLSSNSTNPTIAGINVNATGTNTISNNLIGDLRTPNATGNNAVSGIIVANGTTNNIYHNTVNIAATSTSATTFGTSGIYLSSATPVNTLRNNIFVNTSVSGPTGGFTAAIRYLAAPTTTNFSTSNNNNLYFAGTPSATNLIYGETATATAINPQQTLAGYKAYISAAPAASARESTSISENPLFASTIGSNPVTNFLKYTTTTGLQLEQGGGIGTGITDDFLGTVRCPGATCPGSASTPDIGAWELSGIPVDLSSPAIVYTPVLTGCGVGTSVTVTATISDASGVPTTGAGLPVVYWKVNSGSYTATPGTFVSGSTYSFTFGGTTTASTDIVSYYFAAQDNATTPNVGTSPAVGSTGFTANPPAVATPPTAPSTYSISSTLIGTYTIGAGQTYSTLTAAIAAYNTSCLGGAVIFNLMDTSYSTGETFPIIINPNPQANATNSLTIKPNTTATISGSVASGALLRLNGADFIAIDGSNNGGTDKSLTVTNTSTTAPTAISIASLGAGFGATNNVVRNCNVSTASVTSGTTYGISIGGTTSGTSGADNDTNLVQNNAITVSTVGIYANGTASVSAGGLDNLIISGNSVTSANTSASPICIQVGNALNSSVASNVLSIETNASTQPVAISLETGFVSSTVTLNRIVKIISTNTGGYAGRGITVGTGTATSNVTIANNVINGVNGSNWSSFGNSSSIGIAVGVIGGSTTLTTVTGGVNIYHNTVNMTGSMGTGSTTAITTALFVGSASTALDIRNNIFVNTQVATNATQKNYSIYSLAANTAFTNLNYNDYFVTNTFNAASAQLGFIGSDRTDLVALVAGFGQNANSVTINPSFLSPTNLLPTALALDNLGTPIAGVTIDFLGVPRSAITPDMGAYEGAFGSGPIFTNTTLPNSCTQGDRTLTATITSLSGMPTTGISLPVLYWRINNGAYQASTGASVGGNQYAFNLGAGSVQGDVISYYIIAQDSSGILASFPNGGLGLTSNPPAATTPPTPVSYTNSITLSGLYTVGITGNYPTLTAAVASYNGACLSGAVTFSLIDSTYPSETYPIAINDNVQASAINTLTIKPALGVVTTLTGNSANSIILLNGADFVTLDGSNSVGGTSKDLTVINTNAGAASFVVWNASVSSSNSASNNTFKNLNVIGNAPLTTFGGIFSGSGTTAGGAAETPNNNIVIENNAISKVQFGIAIAGNTAGNTGNIVRQNTIGSAVVGDRVGFKGIFVSNNNGILISKNTIFDIITTALNPFGIDIAANVTNSIIDSNTIRGIQYTGTGGYAGKGIVVNTGLTSSNLTISNNVISDIKGDSWSSLASTDIIVGLRITGTTGGVNVYHNSINLGHGTFAGNTNGTFSAAFHIGAAVTALDVRNNIFASNLLNSVATTAKSYAIASEAPITTFTNINNNDYYVNGSQGILGFIGNDRVDLTSIQTGFGQNVASVNIVPLFISATDLHLVTTTNNALSDLGTFILTVTLDIDGETRSTTTPDMGADEFCNATTTTTTTTACGSYLWNVNATTYTASGTYTNVVGCATEVLNLTVNPTPNTATSQIDNTLTATETGATYQWVTCGTSGVFTPISGATAQSYEVTAVGNYAVEITKNGCIIRSACIDVTTLNSSSFDLNNFNYYPNPVISTITFKYDKEIELITVYDLNGRLLKKVSPKSLEAEVDLSDLTSAIYIAKVTSSGKQTEIKLLKK